MNKEDLFRALNDVGEDLIEMAQTKKFSNPWKKWVPLAACMALTMSLGVLALPYFPMGCGASVKKSEEEAPTMDCVVEESAAEDHEYQFNAQQAPAEEAPAEPQEEAGVSAMSEPVTEFVVCHTRYYVRSVLEEEPRELGSYLGDINEADKESLLGCPVYEELYSAQFSNHAVEGQIVTQNVFVKTADGWLYAMTANEKTLSRYTPWDIENALYNGDEQWILRNFVQPLENHDIHLFEGRCDSDCYNRLFLASLQLNTGVTVDSPWLQEDLSLLVHPEDVRQRLSRFVDEVVDYAPETTANYDPETGMLRFTEEELFRYTEGLYLKRSSVEGNRVWLWVGLPETDDLYDEKMYELRFDEDGWRYIHVSTPG